MAKPIWVIFFFLLSLSFHVGSVAADTPPHAVDAVLEAKVMRIASELRCLVCQNQTIADSHAGLAVDLRNQVRDMLQRGQSEQEITDYMTARYGDFVLYRPPLKTTTYLLWLGPLVMVLGGLAILVWVLWRRSRLPPSAFDPEPGLAEDPNPKP